MNKLGVARGVSNSKDIISFRQKNVITKQARQGSLNIKMAIPEDDFVYGKPNW